VNQAATREAGFMVNGSLRVEKSMRPGVIDLSAASRAQDCGSGAYRAVSVVYCTNTKINCYL
jgi:hypothetical protein